MNADPYSSYRFRIPPLDAAFDFGLPRRNRSARDRHRSRRFVTQSHVLGAPIARPGPLLIAATVAVAVVWIARRLID